LVLICLLSGCSSYKPYVIQTVAVGAVLSSEGFPAVLRNSRPYILAPQSVIYPGDVVTTDEQSLVVLKLDDGSTLSLGTRSQLLVKQIEYDSEKMQSNLSLSRGSLEFNGAKASRNDNTISTTSADIHTESKHFWIGYTPGTNVVDVVSLSEAEILVTNINGSTTLDSPLETSAIPPGSAPQDPLIWSEKKFEELRNRRNRTRW
jgi:uncharacterized DUF497 family protein